MISRLLRCFGYRDMRAEIKARIQFLQREMECSGRDCHKSISFGIDELKLILEKW